MAAGALCLATPAAAEVVPSGHGGFTSSHSVLVAMDRELAWSMLIEPEIWWHHTFSGNPANLTLDPRAGGCFCEALPGTDGAPPGSAEHMRVLMVQPHSLLRMSGALGPLQAEGLTGTLTVTLEAEEGGTRIRWNYVVGGQSRMPLDELAPVVDRVQGEFLGRLADALGGMVIETH